MGSDINSTDPGKSNFVVLRLNSLEEWRAETRIRLRDLETFKTAAELSTDAMVKAIHSLEIKLGVALGIAIAAQFFIPFLVRILK